MVIHMIAFLEPGKEPDFQTVAEGHSPPDQIVWRADHSGEEDWSSANLSCMIQPPGFGNTQLYVYFSDAFEQAAHHALIQEWVVPDGAGSVSETDPEIPDFYPPGG